MNCAQYLERVERALTRATKREKKEIRAELQGHLEDHREVFLSLGCTPTEADHRAAEAMGDPGETGRALNDQLSTFWLWVDRAVLTLFGVLTFWGLLILEQRAINLSTNLAQSGQTFFQWLEGFWR